jgi:MinD-like ATPase involved in chromosome partitioning or flagellar assembly
VTEGERDPEYPDGSVGRYVREQWSADATARRSRRRPSSTLSAPPTTPRHATPVAGLEVVPPEAVPAQETPETERSAGPDIVRSDGTGTHAVPEVPRTRLPSDGGLPARQAVTDPVATSSPRTAPEAAAPHRAATDPVATRPPRTASEAAAPHRISPAPTPPRGVGRWVDPGAVAAQEAQRARSGLVSSGFEAPGDLPTDLSSARLLRPAKRPPQSGWRRLVYVLSGRVINPGESPADIRRRELIARINAPLLGCHKIALLSLKGGVGKTTMTATLGATFASLRGDRVVAVDANPDRGTLSQKIPLETSATVRHLLRDAQRVRRYTDVRAYTSQGASRLEVLASEQDPAVSEAFSEDDYRRTVNLLEHFYNMVLTDCGTGLMHSAMYGVLGVADQIVVVSSGSIDGARSASATMDWLDAHGHGDLVRNAVAVINCVSRSAGGVDLDRVAEHFAGRCRAVVRIPFDPHLQEGAEVDLDRLDPRTRMGLLELAAEVADAFPS